MEKIRLSDIRAKFPMYDDLSDDQLLIGLRKKFYSDIPPQKFYNMVDYDTQKVDPTAGMSTFDKVMAGAGKSVTDIGRSVKRLGNMVGIGDYTAEKAAEDQKLDQALMNTTAGQVGKVGTDIALTFVPGLKGQQMLTKGVEAGAKALPRATAAINVAAPYVGAAGSGAALGALTSPEDMGKGATIGAIGGAGGELAGRALTAGYQAGKAILDPLTEQGRNRVLKRTIDRFASDPAAVRARAANPEIFVSGVTPTLAEATGDAGIAQLQRSAAASSPDVANALAEARSRQVAGYKDVLDSLSGSDADLAYAVASRENAAQNLYGQAFASDAARREAARNQVKEAAPFAGVGGGVPTPDLATPGLRGLMDRPLFKQAAQQAKTLAANKGVDIGNPIESLQGLHYIKLALDDMANPQAASAMGRNASSAVNEMRTALTKELETVAPTYGAARSTYAGMSRPINQIEIARALREKAIPALDDLSDGALARVNANRYALALRNADELTRNATGMKAMGMSDIMEPGQMRVIEGVGKDMARYAAAQDAGKVAGSPTAQYLAGQNVLRQVLGPLGLPQGIVDTAIGRMLSFAANLPYKMTANQTEQALARALTDPAVAAKILATKDPKTFAEILQPYAAQVMVQATMQ